MKLKIFIGAVVFPFFFAGCGTPVSAPPHSSAIINTPALNVESSAEVGQSMVSTIRRTDVPAIRVVNGVTHSGGTWTISIPPAVLPMYMANAMGSFYRVVGPVSLSTLGVQQPSSIGGVFVPNDQSKPTQVFWMGTYGAPLMSERPGIEYSATVFERYDNESFKRELVYSGVSQNTVSILYREFQNDMARPAFSQELKYDLAQGTAIGYKGARFEVIRANNTGISYKVLKSLD
jgi:hypothetical protein